jgi:hypothetical protein
MKIEVVEDTSPADATNRTSGGFKSLMIHRASRSIFPPGSKPCLYVSPSHIYLNAEVYKTEGLEKSVEVSVRIDKLPHQIKLNAVKPNSPAARSIQRKTYRSSAKEEGTVCYYCVGLPSGQSLIKIISKLARGYYVPLGAGVFEYSDVIVPLY